MITYQWCIFLIIFALLFIKASRVDALILFVIYSTYQILIINLDDVYYYSASALLNLVAANTLVNTNTRAATCSCLLVFANLIGFFLWYLYFPPDIYDVICFFILVTQLILILPKGLLNGLGYNIKHIVAKSAFFDGTEARVTMCKNQTKKEVNR